MKGVLLSVIGYLFLLPPMEGAASCYSKCQDSAIPSKGTEAYIRWLETVSRSRDSVYKAENAKVVAEVQAKYELQKKESTIIQQQLDLARKDFLTYLLLLIALGVLATTLLLLRNHRLKVRKKMNELLRIKKQKAFDEIRHAEEKERMRIAADLHDNLGAYAASMASNLDAIEIKLSNDTQAGAFQELRNNSQSIISQLNDTIWVIKKESRPLSAISDRIKMFLQQLQPSYPFMQMEVDESIDNDHILPAVQAFHLYRIVQEAINNALKHSEGNRITVKIVGYAGWMISIADNGVGIDNKPAPGNGLYNMGNRAEECGWKLEIEWGESNGTIVSILPESALQTH